MIKLNSCLIKYFVNINIYLRLFFILFKPEEGESAWVILIFEERVRPYREREHMVEKTGLEFMHTNQ